MFNFVFLCPKRWFQFISEIVRTHFSSIMTSNNWKMIAETQSYIFRWRSCFCRRRVCLSSLLKLFSFAVPWNFIYLIAYIYYLWAYHWSTQWSPPSWPDSSTGRALHRQRIGQGLSLVRSLLIGSSPGLVKASLLLLLNVSVKSKLKHPPGHTPVIWRLFLSGREGIWWT